MAVLLDLSNELVILIASHISKPSHILQLALANKRIHGITIQHLYENVTFDRDDYPPFPTPSQPRNDCTTSSLARYDHTSPHSNILRLSNMIRSNTLPTGQIVTRLAIIVGVNQDCNKFQTFLSLLLPQLSSLKHLTLESVSENGLAWQREHFSLAPLGNALSHTSQTLQSLSMHFFPDHQQSDGWTIGSLRHFSKLKYLSVQGNVLLGQRCYLTPHTPPLESLLPPGLKTLRLHWSLIEGVQSLRVVLADFVKDSLRDSREMEEFVVRLNAKAICRYYRPHVESLGRSLLDLNEEARLGGLDLRIALEWMDDYHCVAGLVPELTFVDQFNILMQT